MALSLHFSPLISAKIIEKPGLIGRDCTIRKPNWITDAAHLSKRIPPYEALKVKAMENQPSTKPNSIICADCEGDGAKKCPQCEGSGVNSVDHFNGQFKAGGLCWLCRGKKEILCGNCNGAGFIGGFMSTYDD